MAQRILFSIVLLINFINCKAQTTEKTTTMVSYTKKIKNLDVKMLVETNIKEEKTSWNIYVYKSKKDSILIDRFESHKIYKKENLTLAGDIRKHISIGDVVIENKTIYIMLYKHGNTYLKTYTFLNDEEFIKNEYFAGYCRISSFMNFGHPYHTAEIKIISKDEVYIKFKSGQPRASQISKLLRFNNQTQKLTEIIFNKIPFKAIEDNNKIFQSLDFTNKEKTSEVVTNFLIESKSEKKNDNPNYINFMYDYSAEIDLMQRNKIQDGIIYFFYQRNKIKDLKIIRYRYKNGKTEWLIDNLKEKQISQPAQN